MPNNSYYAVKGFIVATLNCLMMCQFSSLFKILLLYTRVLCTHVHYTRTCTAHTHTHM